MINEKKNRCDNCEFVIDEKKNQKCDAMNINHCRKRTIASFVENLVEK